MTTAVAEERTYRPEDLLRMSDGHRYELVDGKLVERHMGSISSWVGGVLYAAILEFCRANRVGWVWHADAGFQCFPRQGAVRYPNVSVVRFGRLPGEQLPEGYIAIPPDLAVEAVSPNDRVEELEDKLADYLAAGVQLVWVIYPHLRTARGYRPDGTSTPVAADGFLDGEAVLPGFRVRLAELFPPSPPPPATP